MKIYELHIHKPDKDDTLGISRGKMPQVSKHDYNELFYYLKDHGITSHATSIAANGLKPIQKDFADKGVEKALNKRHIVKPVIISNDGYLIDGHHRWLAQMNINGDTEIPVIRVNAPVQKLLPLITSFPKTTFKEIY